MKTTSFLKKNYFHNGILAHLFKRAINKKRSLSLEELKKEISTDDYREKVRFLIKQDLLLRYNSETVENGLKNFDIQITTENSPQLEVARGEEHVPFQEPPTPGVRMNEILTDEKQQEVLKVENRIPRWFKKPNQYNSQILIAYMELLGDNKSVPKYKLEAACKTIETFQSNYNQMKIIGDKNHAKVFEEIGNRITLWEPVRNFVKKEYEKYLRRR